MTVKALFAKDHDKAVRRCYTWHTAWMDENDRDEAGYEIVQENINNCRLIGPFDDK